MKSPFPGMDPYLEDPAFWRDFHQTFIGCWREAIADVLPEPYEARLDVTVQLVRMPDEIIKLIYPDVAVTRRRSRPRRIGKRGGGTAVLAPKVIPHAMLDQVRQARIRVLHRPDQSLVAVLEMLSPTNKSGDGFADYCSKRTAILQQKAHLVELDLLLGGRRLPLAEPLPNGDYHALISRADRRPDCEVYSWTMRQPLPAIPVPLKAPDRDVVVDLQAVFRRTYKRGRYGRSLRYGEPPPVPLNDSDVRWVVKRSRLAPG